jgi:hypothetical protein
VRTIFHALIVTHTFESQWPAELTSSLVYQFCALIIVGSSLVLFGEEERQNPDGSRKGKSDDIPCCVPLYTNEAHLTYISENK